MPSTELRPPFDAYRGSGPYVFASYAHADAGAVFPDLRLLRSLGAAVWFDEGIDPGNEWPDDIARAIEQCSLFVYFISPASVASRNCRNEVYFALSKEKPILAIHLKETAVPPGIELSLSAIQAVMKFRMDPDSYTRGLKKALAPLFLLGTSTADSTVPEGKAPDVSQRQGRPPVRPEVEPLRGIAEAGSARQSRHDPLPDGGREMPEHSVLDRLAAASSAPLRAWGDLQWLPQPRSSNTPRWIHHLYFCRTSSTGIKVAAILDKKRALLGKHYRARYESARRGESQPRSDKQARVRSKSLAMKALGAGDAALRSRLVTCAERSGLAITKFLSTNPDGACVELYALVPRSRDSDVQQWLLGPIQQQAGSGLDVFVEVV